MTGYPRKCTIQEAIDCMLAGGKVSAKYKSDPDDYWSHFKSVYGYDAGNYEYRIDAPAHVVKQIYSTAAAIAELFENKPGEVEFTGENSVYSQFTLFLCNTKTVQIRNWDGSILNYIPNTTWVRKEIKPKLVTGEDTILQGQNSGHSTQVFDDIRKMCQLHPCSKVRITYTVEAID